MTKICGIYILKFNGSDKVYVGQSVDIYGRYKEHLSKLTRNQHQPKLSDAYKKYGVPILEIACECIPSELDKLEQEAIDIWNAVENGYNFNKESWYHGPSLPGASNSNSQYTREEYIKMFDCIVDTNIPIKELSELLNVNKNVLYQISNGSSHREWLEKEFPEKYKILINKRGTRRNRFSLNNSITLIYGNSEKEETLNSSIKEFAIKHGLNSAHIGAVINGKLKQHKGWKLKQ